MDSSTQATPCLPAPRRWMLLELSFLKTFSLPVSMLLRAVLCLPWALLMSFATPAAAQEEQSPSPLLGNPSGSALSLTECVQEAITNNPSVREARALIEASKGAVISAKAALYPIVESEVRVGYDNDDIFNSDENKEGDNNDFYERWQIDIDVTRRLYDGTATRQTISIAKLNEDIAWNQYLDAVNTTVYETQVAFYQVLFARKQLGIRQEDLGRLNVITERQKSLQEGGRSTRYDILRAQVKSTNQMPLIEKNRSDVIAAEATLQQVMGRRFDPATLGRIAVSGDFVSPSFDLNYKELVNRAIRNSPLLTAAEKQIEISTRGEIKARSTKYPQVDLFAGGRIERDPDGSNYFDSRTEFSFGLLAQWTLFDGFSAKGKIKEAKAFIERDTIRREELVKTIQFEALRALLDLKEARAVLAAGQSNRQSALESLESLGKSLELGMTTQLDVYDANEDLFEAESVLLQAQFDYHVALAKLEKVTSAFVRKWVQVPKQLPSK